MVTLLAYRVRKVASSAAVSPPPTTTSRLPRNTGSAPSHTAQAEIPRCHRRSAPGTSRRLAVAPVAMIRVRVRTVPPLSVVTA